jgi:hypothetical protein
MQTDFKGLHFPARNVRKKGHSRGVREYAMSKPSRKKNRTVEVQIMFEPNRLEQHSLHKAYSCLVPLLKRRLLPQTTAIEAFAQTLAPVRERKLP